MALPAPTPLLLMPRFTHGKQPRNCVTELTSIRQQSRAVASTSSSTKMLSPRLPRTSVLCAPARRVLDMLAPLSTASSPSSCSRVVTSPVAMYAFLIYPYCLNLELIYLFRALAASPSTARSLLMRTSPASTPSPVFSPWPTLGPTRKQL